MNEDKTYYIVGKNLNIAEEGSCNWEFQGLFDNEELAIKACKYSSYFVGPVKLNAALPDKREECVGAFYPHYENIN